MRWDLDLQTTESIGHLVAIKFCIKRSFDRVSPALISDPILFSLVTPPQVYIEQYFFPTLIHVSRGVNILLPVNIRPNLHSCNLPRFSLPCSMVDLVRDC
jgi:hypothetical protein